MENLTQNPSHSIHDIALSPTYMTDGIGYAASQSGLYKTTNYCSAWESVGEAIPLTKLLYLPNLILVTSVGSISKSTTKGNTWTSHSLPVATSVASALVAYDDYLLLGTLDDGVLRSDDEGATWRGWNFGLLDWRILSLAVTAQNIVFVGTETGLFVSHNGGKSWQVSIADIQCPILSLVAYEGALLIATEEGQLLHLSPEDESLTTLFKGEDAINAIAKNNKNHLAILDGETLYFSKDQGQSWAKTETQVDDALSITWANERMIIVGSFTGVLASVFAI